jgi:DNA-binding CsgD family transcriptional regulator
MDKGSIKVSIITLRKQGKSYREIEKELGCSRNTISYHCRKEMLEDIGLSSGKKLTEDDIIKLKEFYKKNTIEETALFFGISRSTVIRYKDNKRIRYDENEVKKLGYKYTKTFRKRMKEKSVEYKGGKCIICEYDRCISALDFHHIDPSKKDFNLSQNFCKSWDTIKKELDKCVLLCSNCHREVHEGITTLNI